MAGNQLAAEPITPKPGSASTLYDDIAEATEDVQEAILYQGSLGSIPPEIVGTVSLALHRVREDALRLLELLQRPGKSPRPAHPSNTVRPVQSGDGVTAEDGLLIGGKLYRITPENSQLSEAELSRWKGEGGAGRNGDQ